jgi:hypothetical protein
VKQKLAIPISWVYQLYRHGSPNIRNRVRKGPGKILNVPLPKGAGDAEFLGLFKLDWSRPLGISDQMFLRGTGIPDDELVLTI